MELKHVKLIIDCYDDTHLLIVPYGIETKQCVSLQGMRVWLLIVPYGIETHSFPSARRVCLTFNRTLWN